MEFIEVKKVFRFFSLFDSRPLGQLGDVGEAGSAGREKGNLCTYIYVFLCLVFSHQTYRAIFECAKSHFGPAFGF